MQAIETTRARGRFTALVKDAAAGQQYYVLTHHGKIEAVLIGYTDWTEGAKHLPVAEELRQTMSAIHARNHLSECRTAARDDGVHTLLTVHAGNRKDPTEPSAVLAPHPWVIEALDVGGPIAEPDHTTPAGAATTEPESTPADAVVLSANQARAGFPGYVKDAAAGQQFLLRNRGSIEARLLGYPQWLDLCTTHPVDSELQQSMGVIAARDHLGECRTAAHISGIHTLITADADKYTDPTHAIKAVLTPYPWATNTPR
ncbi:type II toxin-antitoxin system Phd/YefM family antitoxin [Nocardia sp. NPDC003963]